MEGALAALGEPSVWRDQGAHLARFLGCGLLWGKGLFVAQAPVVSNPQVVNYLFVGKPLGPKCVLE